MTAVLFAAGDARAARFNVADGDYNADASWIDSMQSPTTSGESGFILNGGIARITSDAGGARLEVADGTVEHEAGDLLNNQWVDLGTALGKTGTYNLASGARLLSQGGNLRIAVADPNVLVSPGLDDGGSGVLTTRGTVTVPEEIIVGMSGAGTGVMNVHEGMVDAGIVLKAGFEGTGNGTINQTGGTVVSRGWVDIASNPGATNTVGAYNLSGGTLHSRHTIAAGGGGDGLIVGNAGTGTFNQTGGIVNADKDLRIGFGNNNQNRGTGVYTQSAGDVNVGKHLRIGSGLSDAQGTYNLNGGALNIGSEWIDIGGQGGLAAFGVPALGRGTLNITGGTIRTTGTGAGAMQVGLEGSGVVNQSGGEVFLGTNGGNLSLGYEFREFPSSPPIRSGKGIYNLSGGLLDLGGKVIEAGFPQADFNFTGGTLRNVGTYAASLEQEGGVLAPGAAAATGTMKIDNDYNLKAGAYQVQIAGLNAHDILDVGINAKLDFDGNGLGTTLQVALLGGYVPVLGNSFTVLRSGRGGPMTGTVTGQFANLDASLAALGAGLTWNVVYNPQSVVLSVVSGTAAIPGDFDANGAVNTADLQIWQTNLGLASGAVRSQGDSDADGDVDGKDFLTWQAQFGRSAAARISVGAVPEPSSLVATLVGCGLVFSVRRRRGL